MARLAVIVACFTVAACATTPASEKFVVLRFEKRVIAAALLPPIERADRLWETITVYGGEGQKANFVEAQVGRTNEHVVVARGETGEVLAAFPIADVANVRVTETREESEGTRTHIHESYEAVELTPDMLPERSEEAPPADETWVLTQDGQRHRFDPGRIRREGDMVVVEATATEPPRRFASEDVHAVWFEERSRRVLYEPPPRPKRKGVFIAKLIAAILVGAAINELGGDARSDWNEDEQD